jgi:hypothetical protein
MECLIGMTGKDFVILAADFEDKLRTKEEEEASVKREIAEIALALNMETKKVKDELFSFTR